MVHRVAAIAERDQICRFIGPARSARNQVMNIGFAAGTRVTARSANMAVASEYHLANLAPTTVLLWGLVE